MYTTGRIEKEDPNKHIIEYEDKKEDDLSDLKKLISKKSGWYKVAVADGEFRDLKNKVEKIKDDIRDFKKENKEFNDKLKKIEKIIEDLNIGNRQFWQTQNIFTSLQRKIEKFEVITQEWAKFKKEIDKDIRNIIEKKTKAQVK
jgi:predicted transcriptional regulator